MKVPDRKDDSPAEFRRQQDLIREQVRAKMDARFEKDLKELLDNQED